MLVFEDVCKSYAGPAGPVPVLRDLSFQLHPGQIAVIQGPSGCGKSTLLFTAGAMLRPDQGRVRLGDRSVYALSSARRNALRGAAVGFVFQRFHLIPYLDVAGNILWPVRWRAQQGPAVNGLPELARRLKLEHRLDHRPDQLSAGEQQRVAIARAVLGGTALICADEPTGNLDPANAAVVLKILREEADRGAMVLLVTHTPPPAYGDLHLTWTEQGVAIRRPGGDRCGV